MDNNLNKTTTIFSGDSDVSSQNSGFIFEELKTLSDKISQTKGLPVELKERLDQMLDRLNRMAKFGHYAAEFDTLSRYIDVLVK